MTTDLGTLAVLAPLLLLLIGLGFTVWVDPYIGRERRRIMLLIVVLSLSLIAQNVLEYRCAVAQPRANWRTALTIYGYAVRRVVRRLSRGNRLGVSALPLHRRTRRYGCANNSTRQNCRTTQPYLHGRLLT